MEELTRKGKTGNSVVHLLEDLFPESIDKIKEDQGSKPGPLPLVMKYSNEEDLFIFLFGSNENNLVSKKLEFGAHQVVITRNQETKKLLPPLLQHALVLTVFEAKGLEFDEVILFNFFSDSPNDVHWNVLLNLDRRSQKSLASLDSAEGTSLISIPSSLLFLLLLSLISFSPLLSLPFFFFSLSFFPSYLSLFSLPL